MKKYLAVFDRYKFSKSTLNYAIQLTQLHEAQLVAVFLDEFNLNIYNSNAFYKAKGIQEDNNRRINKDDLDRQKRADILIQKACDKAKIKYSIHLDTKIAEMELKQESSFADLIIVNKTETFTRFLEKIPSRFIRNILSGVHCPVLVVPDIFKPLDKIVLLYDGGPSSLHAIKMFSYLLPVLKELPVEIVTVNEYYLANLKLPGNKLMREFVKMHFPKAKITVFKGNAEEQIIGHLRNHKENALLVLGAYKRSELSRLFKISMADTMMRELDTPLFIAHS